MFFLNVVNGPASLEAKLSERRAAAAEPIGGHADRMSHAKHEGPIDWGSCQAMAPF